MEIPQKLDANGKVINVGDYGWYECSGTKYYCHVTSLTAASSVDGISICDADGNIRWLYHYEFNIKKRKQTPRRITIVNSNDSEPSFTLAQIKEAWDDWYEGKVTTELTFPEFLEKFADPEYKEYLRMKAKFES
jgi:hypothetical protein